MPQNSRIMRSWCESLGTTLLILIMPFVCMADDWKNWKPFHASNQVENKTEETGQSSQSSASVEGTFETGPSSTSWGITILLICFIIFLILCLKLKPKSGPPGCRNRCYSSYSSEVIQRHGTGSDSQWSETEKLEIFYQGKPDSDHQKQSQDDPNIPNSNESQRPPQDHDSYYPFKNDHYMPPAFLTYRNQLNNADYSHRQYITSFNPQQINVHLPTNSTVFVGEPYARIKFVTKEGNSDVNYSNVTRRHYSVPDPLPSTSSQDSAVNLSPSRFTPRNYTNPFECECPKNPDTNHFRFSTHDRNMRQDMPFVTLQRRDSNPPNNTRFNTPPQPNTTSRLVEPKPLRTTFSYKRSEVRQAPQTQNSTLFFNTQESKPFETPLHLLRNRKSETGYGVHQLNSVFRR